jgi:chemotaxis protein histidine kinase CheA
MTDMSLDDQPRQPADTYVGRIRADLERSVRDCLDEVFDTAARERAQAVEAAFASARAQTDAAIDAAVACAREEWAEDQEAQLARAREEARQEAMAEAATHAREEAAREHEAALAQAREQVREEARKEYEAALADAREQAGTEARQEYETLLARFREEVQAEQERMIAEVRASAEREAAETIALAEAARAEAAHVAASLEPMEAVASVRDDERVPAATTFGAEAAGLRNAVARLDEATSLSECLDALSDGVSEQTARSMVFVLRGRVLRAWRLSGFAEAPPSPASLSVPLDLSGDLWQVAERGRQKEVQPQTFGRDTDPVLAFAHLDGGATGLATPVLVAGRTVALVYADSGDANDSATASWPACVEVLARHASRCLEALTATRAVAAATPQAGQVVGRVPTPPVLVSPAGPGSTLEAPVPADLEAVTAAERYAKLLVSEVKLYNEAAVRVARHKKDIRTRLRAEIDRARRLYHERVPAGVTTRDEIFDQEIVRTLADGQPELLGTDMSEAV